MAGMGGKHENAEEQALRKKETRAPSSRLRDGQIE